MTKVECIKYEENNEGLIILQQINHKKIIGYISYQILNKKIAKEGLPENSHLSKYLEDKYLDYPVRGMNWSLYVDEKYRGKQFGKILINERLKILRKKHIETFYVDITGNSGFHESIYKALEKDGLVKIKDKATNSYLVLSLN